MASSLHSQGILLPNSSRSREVVSGKGDFFFIANTGDQQVVLDGAEPVIRIKWLDTLGKERWVGVLKVSQLGARFLVIVVVIVVVGIIGNILGYLLKCGDASCTFSPMALAVFHEQVQKLGQISIGWWWRIGVIAVLSACSGRHPEDKLRKMINLPIGDTKMHNKYKENMGHLTTCI